MTQASANGGLEILVEASINHDLPSGLIGGRILSRATAEQISTAREYCRIKHRYTGTQIENAIGSDPYTKSLTVEAPKSLLAVGRHSRAMNLPPARV